ncbi:MAG TPA: hypothetical protein VFG71_14195 [Nitrospiraceae bacterium]|nr:hypothetical protein [Nitrospiraceae bacterium]
MILLIAAVIGLVCPALPGLPAHAGSAPTSPSTTTVEIRYPLPAAGEVILVWGVNGWRQIPEDMRPSGTVIHQKVMATPMARKDNSFVLTVAVESGAMIDYGFLVKQTVRGTPVEVWDGDYAYGPTTTKPDIVTVKSTNLYQNPLVLMDRTGMLFVLGLGVMVTALLGIALWSLWSQSRSGAAREPSYDDARFATVVAVLAFIIGMVVILHHEMWRDELQAWRIATESRTLSDLLENSRYEGHPLLWYLCLYVLSRVSHDPILMQVFHLGIGVTAIFVICRFAPFTRWQKACLACGYFFFYEYLILSRNYALGVLALVSFCAIRAKWPDRILTCAVCLAVMINTSAFGAMIALACGGWLLLESFRGADRDPVSVMSRVGVVLVLAAGMAVAMVQTAPPPDNSPRMQGWSAAVLVEPLERTVSAIWKTYVPLPLTLPHFWNTNLLDEMPRLQTILSIGLLASAALMLRRTPSVMLLYLVATSGLLLFMHFKVNHGIRHTGHLFLVLLACLWLSFSERRVLTFGFRSTAVTIGVTLLFASHAVAGALAAVTDLALPFSAGKETAAFIQRRGYVDATLVGSKYFIVSTVANYLDRPMYYAETAHFGTFSRWKGQRSAVAPADLVRTAREMAHVNRKDVLMVVSYDLGVAGETVPLLASFQRSIFTEERYWLYLIPYQEPIGTGGDGI